MRRQATNESKIDPLIAKTMRNRGQIIFRGAQLQEVARVPEQINRVKKITTSE